MYVQKDHMVRRKLAKTEANYHAVGKMYLAELTLEQMAEISKVATPLAQIEEAPKTSECAAAVEAAKANAPLGGHWKAAIKHPEVRAAMETEIKGWKEHAVYTSLTQAEGEHLLKQKQAILISTRWVVTNKATESGTVVKARCVCSDGRGARDKAPHPSGSGQVITHVHYSYGGSPLLYSL